MQAEKKQKLFAAGAAGGGSRRTVMADGEGNGGGVAAAVLAGWLVLNKSKTNCVPRLVVLFNRHSNLFCTVSTFAPWARVSGMLEADEPEGSQAEGLAGRYPPIDRRGRDDEGV